MKKLIVCSILCASMASLTVFAQKPEGDVFKAEKLNATFDSTCREDMQITKRRYDALGHLILVATFECPEIRGAFYSYDPAGNMVKRTRFTLTKKVKFYELTFFESKLHSYDGAHRFTGEKPDSASYQKHAAFMDSIVRLL